MIAASDAPLPPLNTVRLGESGPFIILLHGWQRSLEALRPLGELLARDAQVLIIDLPGFGMSPLPHPASNDGGGWSTSQYADRIKQHLDEAGISKCIIIGHSFGGRITIRLASTYPDLVSGIVLMGSHGIQRQRPLKERVRIGLIRKGVAAAKWCDATFGTRIFKHYLAPRVGSRDYKAAGDLRKTLVKTVNEDQSREASLISCPTLLLWGENDKETTVDIARNLHRLIKNSELHIFPNKGHEPFADVGSHLMASYIDRFLTARGLRG